VSAGWSKQCKMGDRILVDTELGKCFMNLAKSWLDFAQKLMERTPIESVAVIGSLCKHAADSCLSSYMTCTGYKLATYLETLDTKCVLCRISEPRFGLLRDICETFERHCDNHSDQSPDEDQMAIDQLFRASELLWDFAPFVELRDALRGAVPKACDGVDTMSAFGVVDSAVSEVTRIQNDHDTTGGGRV
jgi:hypothetical protein